MDKIKEVLYDDFSGILGRLRDGDYSISEEEKKVIFDFAKEVNNDFKSGELSSEKAAIAIDLVYTLPIYKEEKWPELLADDVYLAMLKGVHFTD